MSLSISVCIVCSSVDCLEVFRGKDVICSFVQEVDKISWQSEVGEIVDLISGDWSFFFRL